MCSSLKKRSISECNCTGSRERRRKREALKGFPIRPFSSYWCWPEMHNNSRSRKEKLGVFSCKIQNRGIYLFYYYHYSTIVRHCSFIRYLAWWRHTNCSEIRCLCFAASVYPSSNAFTIGTNLPGILNEPLPERSYWRVFQVGFGQHSWQRSTRFALRHHW